MIGLSTWLALLFVQAETPEEKPSAARASTYRACAFTIRLLSEFLFFEDEFERHPEWSQLLSDDPEKLRVRLIKADKRFKSYDEVVIEPRFRRLDRTSAYGREVLRLAIREYFTFREKGLEVLLSVYADYPGVLDVLGRRILDWSSAQNAILNLRHVSRPSIPDRSNTEVFYYDSNVLNAAPYARGHSAFRSIGDFRRSLREQIGPDTGLDEFLLASVAAELARTLPLELANLNLHPHYQNRISDQEFVAFRERAHLFHRLGVGFSESNRRSWIQSDSRVLAEVSLLAHYDNQRGIEPIFVTFDHHLIGPLDRARFGRSRTPILVEFVNEIEVRGRSASLLRVEMRHDDFASSFLIFNPLWNRSVP